MVALHMSQCVCLLHAAFEVQLHEVFGIEVHMKAGHSLRKKKITTATKTTHDGQRKSYQQAETEPSKCCT